MTTSTRTEIERLLAENHDLIQEARKLRDRIHELEGQLESSQYETINREFDLDRLKQTYQEQNTPFRLLAIAGLQAEKAEEKQYFLEEIALRLGANIGALVYEPSRKPIPNIAADFGL